jgi:RecA/RadA recombinase
MASAAEIAKSLAGAIGANDEEATVTLFLDTGFAPLNYALSNKYDGGFGGARMVEISGPAASGKTAMLSCAMASAQRQGGIAGLCDHEHAFALPLGTQLGLDPTPGRFVYKKPRTFEESLNLCVKAAQHIRSKTLIKPDAPIVWGFDSLAAMVPQSVLLDKDGNEKLLDKRSMHDNTALARATSASFPAFAQYCDELNVCAIFLNQIRMKIGVMYGDPRKTTGGEAPEYFFSQRIMLSAAKKIVSADKKDVLGMEIGGIINKNKVARPFRKFSYRFMFQPDGSGRFDVERSTIEFLNEQKILPLPPSKDGKGFKAGYVLWEGKEYSREALARHIQKTGTMKALTALLPAAYEPPVLAEVPMEEEAAA